MNLCKNLLLWSLLGLTGSAAADDASKWTWGKGDELGAGHRMTAATIKTALGKVAAGEVIELSHDVFEGAPVYPGFQTPYVMSMSRTADRTREVLREHLGATNGIGFNLERIEMTVHVSTHIDALGHVCSVNEMYGGYSIEETVKDTGLAHGGIEKSPPFIAEGVLIDVAGYKGVDALEPGYAITVSDLEGALARQKTTLPPAAIVMIHTGWGRHFASDPVNYTKHMPGIGIAAARWLAAREVVAVGADTMTAEVVPWEVKEQVLPVHQLFIAEQGIYIIENLKTDELAAKQRYATTVLILPTKFRGATGAPVRIVALN